MSRISAVVSGIELGLLNRLAEANAAAALSSLRLATGKRVNRPSDDPSGFVTLSLLQNRLSRVQATMANLSAATSMLSQTQSAIAGIGTQLTAIRTELLKDEKRSLTPSERAQSQATIDQAIDQINTLANGLIDGRRLLNGSADFHVSGWNSDQVRHLRVYSKPYGSSSTISGTVTQAATQAELVYTGSGGQITSDAIFTLAGKRGSASFSVTATQDLDEVAQQINDYSHQTGVTAAVAGDDLTFTSVDYGSRAGISITVTSGTFNVTGTGTATDAEATINGRALTGDGNRFVSSENGLVYEIEFAPGLTGDFDTLTVSGDALTLALADSLERRSSLSIPGLAAHQLGGISGRLDQIASGGEYSGLDGNTSRALRIVDEALAQLELVEGSVDGFYQAAVTSASELLAELETDLQDAITKTDGYDEQREQTLLARAEQLADNAIAGLAILSQQRAAIVTMIQKIAGLI